MNITPFKAVRPKRPYVKSFSVSVYDNDAKETAYKLNRDNLHSYLRVISPQQFSKADLQPDEAAKLSRAKMDELEKEGILCEEKSPAFYIYSQEKNYNTYTGIIGLADIEDYNACMIKKHELTRAEKEEKMVRFLGGVRSNGNPVLMTFKDVEGWDAFIMKKTEADPEYNFAGEDGAWHRLWVIDAPEDIKKIQALFKKTDAYYIADGHHRCASVSRMYPDVKQFMACFIPEHGLRVHGFHRLMRTLNGVKTKDFLKALEKYFKVVPVSKTPDIVEGVIGLYIKDKWYELHIPQSMKQDANPKHNLDVYIIDQYIFTNILGIKDTRTSNLIRYANGGTELKYLAHAVDKKEAKAAFALKGLTVEDVMHVADYNETMPPKSTWIEPKMRSGLLINKF